MPTYKPARHRCHLGPWSLALIAVCVTSLASFAVDNAAAWGQSGSTRHVASASLASPGKIGTPTWWKGGTCDPANYPGSRGLGASWDGLVACGPGPTQGGSDHLVSYFAGAWGEYEWECVELSMRWMYLAWGVNPYPANGWDVVSDYETYKAGYNPNGPNLVVVDNGTPGAVPQPGDVISTAQNPKDSYGHTAVVTASSVNDQGNGSVTLIQQNGGKGNNGWVTYPVQDWVVGNGVSSWLHNPSWAFQRPVVGLTASQAFEARIARSGSSYQQVATGASSIAVAGSTGANGTNGSAVYGYMDGNGNFYARRASSQSWRLIATHVKSIALAMTSAGTPVLAYLSSTGLFYAREGTLTGTYSLEASGVNSIALAGGGGSAAPLLGYIANANRALIIKAGVVGGTWNIVRASGVRAFALTEGTTASSGLMGYVSGSGTFCAAAVSQKPRWITEARNVKAISLAAIGPSGKPLLGYLEAGTFYAAESLTPTTWTTEATSVTQIGVASGSALGASAVLGYTTPAGELEVAQGSLSGHFSAQALNVSSFSLSTLTDS
jgi:hypothetical protein